MLPAALRSAGTAEAVLFAVSPPLMSRPVDTGVPDVGL